MTAIGTSGAIAGFVYDGFNRRKTATLGSTAISYLYSGDDVVQELQSGSVTSSELNGLSPDERFSRAGSTYLTDLLGSTVALASGTAVQTSYAYDPYGVAQAPVGAASTNPFQFTGRENDATTAGLMYYRARYYNPSWGRFVSEDPIGVAGGVNLYAYVAQQPTNGIDPSGLAKKGPLVEPQPLGGEAPWQVMPGIRELIGQNVNDIGKVQPWHAFYDWCGRVVSRIDWNDPGANKTDPHYHVWDWTDKSSDLHRQHFPGDNPWEHPIARPALPPLVPDGPQPGDSPAGGGGMMPPHGFGGIPAPGETEPNSLYE